MEVNWGYRSDDAAVEGLKKAVQLRPDWAEAYCELATAFRLRNRFEEAVAAFEKEAELRAGNEPGGQVKGSPLNIEAWKSHEWSDLISAADMCSKMGRYQQALGYLHRAASLAPEDVLSRSIAGQTYIKLGDIESAKREHDALIGICKSVDRFFVAQCEGYSEGLLEAIERASK
jgi:tetratricopeptide (TPR) repeat protein